MHQAEMLSGGGRRETPGRFDVSGLWLWGAKTDQERKNGCITTLAIIPPIAGVGFPRGKAFEEKVVTL